jgi:hypothetical protein
MSKKTMQLDVWQKLDGQVREDGSAEDVAKAYFGF